MAIKRIATLPTWDVRCDELSIKGLSWSGRVSAPTANTARMLVLELLARCGIRVPYGAVIQARLIEQERTPRQVRRLLA